MIDGYRTLLLLRHAKSDYPAGVADHERPLAPRGIREAALAGNWLRAHAPGVDAVLCSTATRTRQTLERTRIEAPTEFHPPKRYAVQEATSDADCAGARRIR